MSGHEAANVVSSMTVITAGSRRLLAIRRAAWPFVDVAVETRHHARLRRISGRGLLGSGHCIDSGVTRA